MRALTLTQPWAGLVASGIKLIENRRRSIIRRDAVGTRFAIHASREIDEHVYDRIEEIAPELQLLPTIMTSTTLAARTAPPWYRLSRVTSAVIAVATLDKILDGGWTAASIAEHAEAIAGSTREPLGADQIRWFFGPVGYVLHDVRVLQSPVPCRGALGFWTLPADIASRVVAEVPC